MTSKEKCFTAKDALDIILSGAISEVEELDSEDEQDKPEDVNAGIILETVCNDNEQNDDELDTLLLDISPTSSKDSPPEHTYRWRQRKIPHHNTNFNHSMEEIYELRDPLDYFKKFFTDANIENIVEQTNLYSTQVTDCNYTIKTDKDEIEKFIGVQMMMSIVKAPAIHLYWSNSLRYPQIAETIPFKRYQKLRRFLHFADNSKYDSSRPDKLFKIRPVIESVRNECIKIFP